MNASGALSCWGNNSNGQLGDNSFISRASPVAVSGLSAGITAVAAGWLHTCALTATGGVKCWGNGGYGQLGNGSNATSAVPVDVTGLTSGVIAIGVGQAHSCAVLSGGAVKCWGRNAANELGDSTTTQRNTPVDVVGLSSGVASVALGNQHSCALLSTGAAKCWGTNNLGAIGDGTTTNRSTAVDVSGLSSGVTALSAGWTSTCALTTAGTVKCWGNNSSGSLGDGTSTQRLTPVDVLGLSGVTAITAGGYTNCARRSDSSAWCWGDNTVGQLGAGSRVSSNLAIQVTNLAAGVQQLAAGGNGQVCAIVGSAAGILCWGYNASGQMGIGLFGSITAPSAVTGAFSGTGDFAAGAFHTCAVVGGGAKCWGRGANGQLGDTTYTSYRTIAADVTGLSSGVSALAAGYLHSCALTSVGAVKCWGYNGFGALGNASTTTTNAPVDVLGLTSGVTAIAAPVYGYFTCALTGTGGVKCWGQNASGQLGDGSTTNRNSPVDVQGLTSGVTAIAAGSNHVCALTSGGAVKCWGANDRGQLGNNSTTGALTAVNVSGLASGVTAIAAGDRHSCAVTSGNLAYCWGFNGGGQLGDGSYTGRLIPTAVSGGSSFSAMRGGGNHSCGLLLSGGVRCWGDNSYGQLGISAIGSSYNVPVNVNGVSGTITAIATGGNHVCARDSTGALACWGNNDYGQVGNGRVAVMEAPGAAVIGFPASAVSLVSSSNPSLAGQTLTLTANVTGTTPTGTVSFGTAAGTIAGCGATVIASGTAVCSTSALPIGSSNVTATYSGDLNNPSSASNVVTQVVNAVPATVSLISSANPSRLGQGVTFNVGVGGISPTGTVTFYDGAQVIAGCSAVVLSAGSPSVAVCGPVAGLALGEHTITVSYSGDANNGTNSAVVNQVVTQAVGAVTARVVAGYSHVCSVSVAGALRCWGANFDGELGDGTLANRALPVPVPGFASGTKSVASGNGHTCAIDSTSAVWCWGANYYGQLGDGTIIGRTSPVVVSGLNGSALAVANGYYFSCALLADGTVRCWGYNSSGQLGNGTVTAYEVAPVVVSGLSGVVAISAGASNACALLGNGGVKCWGAGRLGDGTTTSRSVPTSVIGLQSGVAQIAAAGSHFCALKIDGSVWCWGGNGNGQLGDGSTTQRLTPVPLAGSPFSAVGISAFNGSTCALPSSGGIKCWGWGAYGKQGTGTPAQINALPADVVGLSGPVSSIAVGGTFTCAMTGGGSVRCWGRNTEGQLGNGTFGVALTPQPVQQITNANSIVAGGFHACTADAAGTMKCWGSHSSGAIGDGTTSYAAQTVPAPVISLAGPVTQASAGGSHTCARIGNALQCWGANVYGQIGDGTTTTRPAPVTVNMLGVSNISLGFNHTCAVTTTGGVKCWGYNSNGQLGNGTTSFGAQSTPVDVTGLSAGVTAVSAGLTHTCALLTGGGVKCWGSNVGKLGDGTTTDRYTPVDVIGLSTGVAAIAAGGDITCALLTSNGVKCWGYNGSGAVGDGTLSDRLVPVDVVGLGSGVNQIGVGGSYACALVGGGVKCWGDNTLAQIGDGTMIARSVPTDVSGLTSGVTAIAVGVQFGCALLSGGAVRCWGDNQAGQIGDGSVGYGTTATGYTASPSLTRPLAVADASTVTASRDAAMIARYLAGIRGSSIGNGVLDGDSQRTDAAQLFAYLEGIRPLLDIDGDNTFNPLTDGVLLTRYLLGLRGAALVAGALGVNPARATAEQVEAYLAGILP